MNDTLDMLDRLIKMDQTSPKRILVVGDGMTDIYVHGILAATCQEGCPKFVEKYRVTVAGGAANAARSLSHWRANVMYFGQPHGATRTRYFAGDVEKCYLRHDDDDADVGFFGENAALLRDAAMRAILSQVYKVNAVLLSDYDKGMLTPGFIRDVISDCQKRGIPCVADVKRQPGLYRGAVLKCNSDYQQKYNRQLSELVYDASAPEPLVVTAGMLNPIIWNSGPPIGLGVFLPPVKCINHVGAGDCFAAHLTLALAYKFSLKDASAVAHGAGRAYVQQRHNAPPPPEATRIALVGAGGGVAV